MRFGQSGPSYSLPRQTLLKECPELDAVLSQQKEEGAGGVAEVDFCEKNLADQIVSFICNEGGFRSTWEPNPSWQAVLDVVIGFQWFSLVDKLI